jgi:Dynamin family
MNGARPALLGAVRGLLDEARRAYDGHPAAARLDAVRGRLDEPLRVALAGRVKAGKSTLLNALVGELLAPTDEGECTRIVTWYRDGVTYRVTLVPREGEPRPAPFERGDDAIEIDLGGVAHEAVERLDIEWPSASLREVTLIDTPGIGALSSASEAAVDFLTPAEERETTADAVVYLMKHLHATDMDFLAAFHDEEVSQATPVNALAVLSRADEVGAGRLDSLESAAKIAARYSDDANVRRLAQTVVPVAGLLAETGATLRESEYQCLAKLATLSDSLEALTLSADRFVNLEVRTGVTDLERQALLDRFGMFGVRLAITLVRDGTAPNANTLARELVDRSGLPGLRRALLSQFAERRDLLKARAGLVAVESIARSEPVAGGDALLAEAERITAGAHELEELRLLNVLRAGGVALKPDDLARAERLLGGAGPSPAARLGLEDPDARAVVAAASEELSRWQRRAESPMASADVADAARLLARSCEALLAAASAPARE